MCHMPLCDPPAATPQPGGGLGARVECHIPALAAAPCPSTDLTRWPAAVCKNTRLVKECLHRFCMECIEKSLRMKCENHPLAFWPPPASHASPPRQHPGVPHLPHTHPQPPLSAAGACGAAPA